MKKHALTRLTANGSMLHYDGRRWKDVRLPSSASLSGVRVTADRQVYACGDNGLVVHGDPARGSWHSISDPGFTHNFASVESYRECIYVAHDDGLRRWDGAGWYDVDFDLRGPSDCASLHASDGVLLSTGYEHVLLFDGSKWKRLVPPAIP